MNFFHTERYFLTIDLSKRLRATSRSRGVCFGVGRFMARSIRHWAASAHTAKNGLEIVEVPGASAQGFSEQPR